MMLAVMECVFTLGAAQSFDEILLEESRALLHLF